MRVDRMYIVAGLISPDREAIPFILEFMSHSEGTSEWKLVDIAKNSQRGSVERVKRKVEKIKQFAREAAISKRGVEDEGVPPKDRDEVQRLKEALKETQAANAREREKAEVY